MTSLPTRHRAPHALLNHLLDQPELPEVIQRLDAGVLTRLIRHVGLEDSAPLISMTTADQLRGVFDEELWLGRAPGESEVFDAERFGLWLEVMMENGPAFAARRVMELDEDLVVLALCRLVRVTYARHPGSSLDDGLDGGLHQEFEHYVVISRNESTWDAVCALLAELNELSHDTLIRLLDRCHGISSELIEDNGVRFHVLTAEETLEEDVAADREERRESQGFVTPTSASVFLGQARSASVRETVEAGDEDPATRAYMKAAETRSVPLAGPSAPDVPPDHGGPDPLPSKVARFIETLRSAEVLPPSAETKLLSAGEESGGRTLPLTRAMRMISGKDPEQIEHRLTELSYLSNTLISGCAYQGRAFKPDEAAEAAVSACNLGGEVLAQEDGGLKDDPLVDAIAALLKTHTFVRLFQVGWKVLSDHVVLFSAMALLRCLHRLRDGLVDRDQAIEIAHTARMLRSAILSGRPWDFHAQVDTLQEILGTETTLALAGLLQEYPTLSARICREGAHPLSPYISSRAHIRTIRHFLKQSLTEPNV